jgi:hypothetical protein
MTKYNGSIQNFLQGVSQQAESARLPEQLEELVNCRSSIVKGLQKRPGSYYLGSIGLSKNILGRTFYHYDRGDTDEAYLFSIGSASLKIYDLFTGTEKTVTAPDGLAYLTATDPETAFKFHTVADTTFIVNSEITPAMQNPSDPDTVWRKMIYCKQANFGKTYEISIDGVVESTHTTPSTVTVASGSQDKRIHLSTTDIIEALATDIETWATAEGVTFEQDGDVIYLEKAGASYKLTTQDGNNGNDLFHVGNEIEQYSALPALAKNGFKVKVAGLDESDQNDYYVEFDTEDDVSIGRGVWKECVGFGVDQDFDPTTMPIQVLRNEDGTFTASEIAWVARKAGDATSNPDPSFVGRTISDVLLYQGRLVFTSEENLIGSVTFDFFNFFALSVLQIADDDPIDTASSDRQVTNLHHSLIFNSALLSFSDSAQFMHPGNRPFTNKDFSLVSKAKYPSSPSCAPVAAAGSVFFPYSFGEYSGVRELQYDAATGNIVAEATTDQITRYIFGNVKQVQASPGYNMLFVRTDGNAEYSDKVYVYEWYNRGGDRLQSAWSEWDFDRNIVHMAFIRNKLYLLSDIGGYIVIEVINLSDEDTTDVPFPVRLDMLERVQGSPNYVDDVWELPADITTYTEDLAVVAAEGTGKEGLLMESSTGLGLEVSGEYILMLYIDHYVHRIYVEEDYVEVPDLYFWVGIPYTAEGIITNPYLRDSTGRPLTTSKLRLNYMEFNLADTGSVTLTVTKGNDTFTKEYKARIIDRIGLKPNDPPDVTPVKLRVGVRSDRNRCKIGFKSSEHTPFSILGADWTGNYSQSGRLSR